MNTNPGQLPASANIFFHPFKQLLQDLFLAHALRSPAALVIRRCASQACGKYRAKSTPRSKSVYLPYSRWRNVLLNLAAAVIR